MAVYDFGSEERGSWNPNGIEHNIGGVEFEGRTKFPLTFSGIIVASESTGGLPNPSTMPGDSSNSESHQKSKESHGSGEARAGVCVRDPELNTVNSFGFQLA